MDKVQLTQPQEKVLRDQVIDLDHPGPILRDFQLVLDYLIPNGVKAAGKYNLLPLDAIPLLDAQLSRPLKLDLKRPQLRSHPYLQGLHLLLRASALTRVEGTGDRTRLMVDPAALDSWNGLILTERYFTLLEAWLLEGSSDMIGERGQDRGDYFYTCLGMAEFWLLAETEPSATRQSQYLSFIFRRDPCHFALLDLFGLIEVQYPPQGTTPWSPQGCKPTPFGLALLQLLEQWAYSAEEDEDEEEDEEQTWSFGQWKELFQPYFPQWQNSLTLPRGEWRDGTFVFLVSLGDVWRRIAIDACSTLDDLVTAILNSVKFDFDHLYEFRFRDHQGASIRVGHPACDDADAFTDEFQVGALPLQIGQSMLLWYDFGDDWKFNVKLERIDPEQPNARLPRVLEKHGKSPQQYPDWD
jgi:hypothetical protein